MNTNVNCRLPLLVDLLNLGFYLAQSFYMFSALLICYTFGQRIKKVTINNIL